MTDNEKKAKEIQSKDPCQVWIGGCHIENDWVVKFEKKVVGNVFDNPELIKKEV